MVFKKRPGEQKAKTIGIGRTLENTIKLMYSYTAGRSKTPALVVVVVVVVVVVEAWRLVKPRMPSPRHRELTTTRPVFFFTPVVGNLNRSKGVNGTQS